MIFFIKLIYEKKIVNDFFLLFSLSDNKIECNSHNKPAQFLFLKKVQLKNIY